MDFSRDLLKPPQIDDAARTKEEPETTPKTMTPATASLPLPPAPAIENVTPNTTTTVTNDVNNSSATSPKQKRVIDPIFYDLEPSPTADSKLKEKVTQERQKRLERLLRFGSSQPSIPSAIFSTTTIEEEEEEEEAEEEEAEGPKAVTEAYVLGAKRAAVRRGFATGFDPTSPEEESKRKARLERFGPPESHPFYKPTDDVNAKEARVKRFGDESVAVASIRNEQQVLPAKTLEVRRDVYDDDKPRLSVIHLFGVDNMSTNDVVAHFEAFGPSWCEWLNDSSCNLVFEDAYTMQRALRGLSVGSTKELADNPADAMEEDGDTNVNGEEDKIKKEYLEDSKKQEDKQEDVNDGMDISGGNRSQENDLKWRMLKPFEKKNRTTPLWGRMATEVDVRPERPNPNSKWSRSVRRQQSMDMDEDESEGSTRRRINTRRVHGVSKDRNSISKSSSSKKPIKMEIDRALSSK